MGLLIGENILFWFFLIRLFPQNWKNVWLKNSFDTVDYFHEKILFIDINGICKNYFMRTNLVVYNV
jgi:hypothetical protein